MIVVGTAGWSVPRISASRFPGKGTHLQRYAAVLRGVEINSSFYRDHAHSTYAHWASLTPPGFRFALKLPQRVTHDGRLRRARSAIQDFFEGAGGLGRRLGPVVVQLPASLAFEARVARSFFALLREFHEGSVVCEPRHASWFAQGANDLLTRFHVGRVAADPPIVPAAGVPGGWPGIAYFRLHGSPRKYWSIYEPARLTQWVEEARSLPRGTQTWFVFDNTAASGAAGNALQLLEFLGPREPRKRGNSRT